MAEQKQPSTATIKRLFALSGNQCAFPNCPLPLIEPDSGKVTGEICHICGANSGGPRYNTSQSAEERHGFDNLILLCPIHHQVIDTKVDTYTVENLKKIKANHEAQNSGVTEPSDELVEQILAATTNAAITEGSLIITYNQMGGQNAHIINNYGPSARKITQPVRDQMLAILRQAGLGEIGFASTQGEHEAHEFKTQLMEVFKEAGWRVYDLKIFMFFDAHKGLKVTIPWNASEAGLPQIVAHALEQTGNPIVCNRGDIANSCGIYVQVWTAP